MKNNAFQWKSCWNYVFGEPAGQGYTETTFAIQEEHLKKLQDYAFLLGKETIDMLDHILSQFFSRSDILSALELLEQGKQEAQQPVRLNVDGGVKKKSNKGVSIAGLGGMDISFDNHIITISEAEIEALIGKR